MATTVGPVLIAIYLLVLIPLDYQRTNGHAQEKSWEQSRSRSRSQTGGNRNFGSNRRLDGKIEAIALFCIAILSII